MNSRDIKKYSGKRVLIVLRNNYKYTVVIPEFEGNAFTVRDVFDHEVTIDCSMVVLITEKGAPDEKR